MCLKTISDSPHTDRESGNHHSKVFWTITHSVNFLQDIKQSKRQTHTHHTTTKGDGRAYWSLKHIPASRAWRVNALLDVSLIWLQDENVSVSERERGARERQTAWLAANEILLQTAYGLAYPSHIGRLSRWNAQILSLNSINWSSRFTVQCMLLLAMRARGVECTWACA